MFMFRAEPSEVYSRTAHRGTQATLPHDAGLPDALCPGVPQTGPGSVRRLVYILSPAHSGSTLLAMLLGTHPDICTVGEIKATRMGDVSKYQCSCGTPILRCEFWKRVRDGMSLRGLDFDIAHPRMDVRSVGNAYARWLTRPLCRGRTVEFLRDLLLWMSPSWRAAYATLQQRNLALLDTLCEVSGKSVIVDSSKSALRLKYLLRLPRTDVRVIRLIRDGRGVTLSLCGMQRRIPMREAARIWVRSSNEGQGVLASVDSARWVQVRYEDLCADPRRVLAQLFRWIGVNPQGGTLDFRSREHHVLGNAMRLKSAALDGPDERWKTVLTAEELRAFDTVAGKLSRAYGYE